jgi:hypothetical protein
MMSVNRFERYFASSDWIACWAENHVQDPGLKGDGEWLEAQLS